MLWQLALCAALMALGASGAPPAIDAPTPEITPFFTPMLEEVDPMMVSANVHTVTESTPIPTETTTPTLTPAATESDLPQPTQWKGPLQTAPTMYKPSGAKRPASSPGSINSMSLNAGDAAVIRCGEYNNAQINIKRSGRPDKPIIIMPEREHCVVLKGNSYISVTGSYVEIQSLVFRGKHSGYEPALTFQPGSKGNRVVNTRFDGFYTTNSAKKQCLVEMWGSNHRVDWNSVTNMIGRGELIRAIGQQASTRPSWGHYIGYNYFGARKRGGWPNGGEIIQLGLVNPTHDVSTLVEFNFFDNIDSDEEMVSVKSSGNTIRRNTFVNCASSLTVRNGNKNTVLDNYIFCNREPGCGGIRIFRDDNLVFNNYVESENSQSSSTGSIALGSGGNALTKASVRGRIYRNLLVNCRYCIVLGKSGKNEPLKDNIFNNNTMIARSGDGHLIRTYAGESGTKFSGNTMLRGQVPSKFAYAKTGNSVTLLPKNEYGIIFPKGYDSARGPGFEHRPLTKADLRP